MNTKTALNSHLATEKISKLLINYTLPAMVGTVVMSLYNIVDRIFIGQGVGPLAISGLALSFPFMIVLLAFGMLIGAGSASRISITLGENDLPKAEKILGNAVTLTFIISGTVVIFSYIFMDDLLALFGGTQNTIHYAHSYMRIIIPGGVLTALYFGLNNIMRASGHPRKAMFNILLGAVCNILLDALFIFVFHWGIAGAAIATVISYFIGSIYGVVHFMLPTTQLRFHGANFKLDFRIIKSIISIGLSPFSMQIGTSLVVILINSTLLKYGGDLAIGAYGIINSVNTLVIFFIVGLNQGSQPIIGYNYGAKQYDRMFRTLRVTVITATIISTTGFIIGVFLPHQVVSFFTRDAQLQAIAATAQRISVSMFPIIGFQIVFSNFFQSIGKAKVSIFLSLVRQFVFLIPAIFLLPPLFGLQGAWAVMPLSDGLSAIVSATIFTLFYRNFKKKYRQTISENNLNQMAVNEKTDILTR
ncbi:MAG: MATE family efflux transporter [Porphyromonadaceae bacterium CG2_30_38_12]|nr:MAG: MATE family efflux transporter [Porphyromonadaceae bacterium CG2_30_38_12]